MLLEDFEKWVINKKKFLSQNNIKFEITKGAESENPAIWADFDTNLYMGRIILWASGFCDMEILSVKTDNRVSYEHFELSGPDNFEEVFDKFFSTILTASPVD